MDQSSMKPLRVEFELQTPIHVPRHPIHLDGLLAWSAVQEAMDKGRADYLLAEEELPLQWYGSGDRWVWQASQLVFTGQGTRENLPSIRKADPVAWAMDRDRVYAGGPGTYKGLIGTGPYRAYLFSIPVQFVERAHAWCVGDRVEIERLLDRIEHIGKPGRIDCGRVKRLHVSEDEQAEAWWKMRAMPESVDEYAQVAQTIRPPYWKRSQRVKAWVPSAKMIAEARRTAQRSRDSG